MPLSPQITITPEDIVYKSFDISAVSYTSSTATYTATGHTFSVGDIVQITGLAPDGYNGTYTITGIATNTFTVANTTNTALTDQSGNSYWASPTDYDYSGGQSVTFIPDSVDLDSGLASVETMINGKNKIYRQSTAPTGSLNTGDVWFDTSNGNKQYYYDGTSWVSVQDTAIAAAQSAATAAQTTADGKNKIYRQGTSPGTTGNAVGDLWFDTSNDNRISRWDGTSWVLNSLGNGAISSLSASKLTAGTIDASVITVSNINAGNISAGTLSVDRIAAASITGAKLVAGTITASQIATGTITATQIAAGTITTDKLSAGTMTGFTIQTASSGNYVQLTGSTNSLDFYVSSSAVAHILPNSAGGVVMHYGASPNAASNPQIGVGSSGGSIIYDGSHSLSVGSSGTSVVGDLSAGSYFYNGGHPTTASTANAYLNSTTGLLARSTSSLRYKVDVSEQSIPLSSILSLVPKSFFDKGEAEARGTTDGLPRILGVIAEEVAEIPTLGDLLVNRDKEGRPDSVNYDRIAIAFIPLLKNFETRLSALEGK